VWFRYPSRKNDWVLKGLNLKIHPNETVALVGESGCGKSTTVALLFRFYDIDHGEILVDGRNIKDYNIADLRRAMGLVMQEPTLFNYTISENILYGNSNALNSEVRESANVANALEFIESQDLTNSFGDEPEVLLRELKRREKAIKDALGEKEYENLAA
jgi:ABC-type multidrug transport system fused ATPase/permease subunit